MAKGAAGVDLNLISGTQWTRGGGGRGKDRKLCAIKLHCDKPSGQGVGTGHYYNNESVKRVAGNDSFLLLRPTTITASLGCGGGAFNATVEWQGTRSVVGLFCGILCQLNEFCWLVRSFASPCSLQHFEVHAESQKNLLGWWMDGGWPWSWTVEETFARREKLIFH